jgi:hypothetical protein
MKKSSQIMAWISFALSIVAAILIVEQLVMSFAAPCIPHPNQTILAIAGVLVGIVTILNIIVSVAEYESWYVYILPLCLSVGINFLFIFQPLQSNSVYLSILSIAVITLVIINFLVAEDY